MRGRHEVKHEINLTDYYVLRQRLRAILKTDSHAGADGSYQIRSLYFDTPEDQALREKLDGVKDRDKYRIRFYNQDLSLIQLEKKSKRGDLCLKESVRITKEEAQKLADGEFAWLKNREEKLLRDLYEAMQQRGLKVKTIVDYQRDPFVYEAGNVRITLDHHIRTGLLSTDFLNMDCVTVPAASDVIILEVKWDDFLPDLIRDIVQVRNRRAGAFSKYAACRAWE